MTALCGLQGTPKTGSSPECKPWALNELFDLLNKHLRDAEPALKRHCYRLMDKAPANAPESNEMCYEYRVDAYDEQADLLWVTTSYSTIYQATWHTNSERAFRRFRHSLKSHDYQRNRHSIRREGTANLVDYHHGRDRVTVRIDPDSGAAYRYAFVVFRP